MFFAAAESKREFSRRYRDGWSVCAWKGVQLSVWMIEHAEWTTSFKISDPFEPVRRPSASL